MTAVITQISLNFRSESKSGFIVTLTHTAPPPGSQKLWHVSVFIEWHRCWWNISRQQAQVSLCLTLRIRVWRSPQENTRQSARAVLWWFQGVSAATPSNHHRSSPKHSGFPFLFLILSNFTFSVQNLKYWQKNPFWCQKLKVKTTIYNVNYNLPLMSEYCAIHLQNVKLHKCSACSLFSALVFVTVLKRCA